VQKVVKYPNLVVQPGEVAELRGEEERLGVAEVEDSPVAAGLPEVVADHGEASLRGVVAADLLLGVAVDLLLGVEVDSGVVADPFGSCSKPFTFFCLVFKSDYNAAVSYLWEGQCTPRDLSTSRLSNRSPPLRPNLTLVGTNPIAVSCSVRSRTFSSLPCTARIGVLHGRDRGPPYPFEVALPFEGFSKEVLLSIPVLIIPKL
jgi:hypothetical protein